MRESIVSGGESCAPSACAMRADERGVRSRAAVRLGKGSGHQTADESARPPAESAPIWRASGQREDNSNRAPAGASRGRGLGESEASWRVNPTVAGRLTRA